MIYKDTLNLIGNTPVVKLPGENIYLKMEKFNPGGSVKDRAALGMIEDAEAKGYLNKNSIIVEPTSGNTGIALALIGRLKGYKVIIVMPETMSVERRNIIEAHGATLILTEGQNGMGGAIARANELVKRDKNYFMPDQFNNPANPRIHYDTTGQEIIKQLSDIDVFTAGVGSGGTISGVGKRLKEYNKNIIVAGAEPSKSPVLSGGSPSPHKIQGIGAGFVPDTYNGDYVDEIVTVTLESDKGKTVNYYAKDVGLVKTVSSGEGYEVSSTLSSVEKNVPLIQTITLFYPNAEASIDAVDVQIEFNTNDEHLDVIEKVVKDLSLHELLSPNTKINELYFNEEENSVHIDLSEDFIREMNAGASFEAAMLQSLANTLGNYYGVGEVYLTIDGGPYESGHILIREGEPLTVK
jgi:cysteine synthase A